MKTAQKEMAEINELLKGFSTIKDETLKADLLQFVESYNKTQTLIELFKDLTPEEIEKALFTQTHKFLFEAYLIATYCAYKGIIETSAYKQGMDRALELAEEHIATITRATGCNVKSVKMLAGLFIEGIWWTTSNIYHPEEWADWQRFTESALHEIDELGASLKKAENDTQKKEIQATIQQKEDELHAAMDKVDPDLFNREEHIKAKIVKRLFPGQPVTVKVDTCRRLITTKPPDAYLRIPSSNTTNLIKKVLNNPIRISSTRRGQITKTEHYLTKDTLIKYVSEGTELNITLERTGELFTRRVENGTKIFNFILQKSNEQNRSETTTFQLEELITAGIYTTKENAYTGLKTILDKMYAVSIEGITRAYNEKGRRKTYIRSRIVSTIGVSFTDCAVSLTPIIRENISCFTLLPKWSYGLSEPAFMLLDYIYYLARQNTDKIDKQGFFNINIDSARAHMGLPTIEEAKREPKKLCFLPIERAIEEIEEARAGSDIRITPQYNLDRDPRTAREHLAGFLRIELDQTANDFMEARAEAFKRKKAIVKKPVKKEA